MSGQKPTVIIVHETVAQSWATDASTFALFAALIGLGWVLGSDAMQWVGAFIGFTVIISRSVEKKTSRRFTVEEARLELDRIERKSC